jgi:hypothetical protein
VKIILKKNVKENDQMVYDELEMLQRLKHIHRGGQLEGPPTTRTVPPLARIFASNHYFDTRYLNNYSSY